jgi:uncharacterized protein YdaU (DUF1376 family)
MNYYSFHIGDYASHTAHLSPMEDLAYRRMLDMYYRTQKPLPADTAQIARHIRLTENISAVQVVLDEFFELGQDGWVNQRAEKEIASYKRMADGGAKGAAKRWAKGGHGQGIATPSPPHANPNANHEPITKNQEPVTNVKTRSPTGSRLPPDWVLPVEWQEWAEAERPDLQVGAVACQFRDYWIAKAGKDGRKLDWAATWRNWVRSQRKETRPINPADVARVTVPSKPDRDPVLVKLEQEALKAVGPTPEQRARMEELRRQARVSTDGQPHKTT